MLGVETLNRFETSFLNTTAQALELIDRVDHPSVGLALDVFHLGIEEKHVGDALRSAGRRLVHLQVAENDRGTPGTGSLPWRDVAKALQEIEYTGRVVIETFSDRVEAIARAAAIWRPLAPDSDTLAREGLAFLRAPTRTPAPPGRIVSVPPPGCADPPAIRQFSHREEARWPHPSLQPHRPHRSRGSTATDSSSPRAARSPSPPSHLP